MGNQNVTIVGAGPSGLTLAWWLVEDGVPVTVLEREPAIPRDMRASTFHPATLDLLKASGLARSLIERGTVVPQWQYLIHETGERAIFDMACLNKVTAHPFRLQCEQFQLTQLLADKLAEHPLCTMSFNACFQDATRHSEGVTILYRSKGEPHRLQSSWVIAADGASSHLRSGICANSSCTLSLWM